MEAGQRTLPPGQLLHTSFDRFGLGWFANKFPVSPDTLRFSIAGDVENPITVDSALTELPRVEQVSNFHCVTTWSVLDLKWSGYRFSDLYKEVVLPLAKPQANADFVVLKGQDGYRTCMHLPDLLAADVLLADTLNGEPLGIAHGAPLRIVAPAHYGYKNMKHLAAIEFWTNRRNYRFPFPYPGFMDHPRARVALEERAQLLPSFLIRYLYRALIPWTRHKSRNALNKYARMRELSAARQHSD